MSQMRGVQAVLADPAEVAEFVTAAEQALAARTVLRGAGESIEPGRIAVVVCLWKRHYRLESILRMVARQTSPCDLYLWNNDVASDAGIRAAVTGAGEAPARVELATPAVNLGGFGRFFWARAVASQYEYVVFVDDDEMLDDDTVTVFRRDGGEHRIASAWGFRFTQRRDYWGRKPAGVGEPAKYCGTGGMIVPTAVFTDDRLFRCPRAYWFCEDIWLSYFASTALGFGLYKSGAEVGWLLDDAAQYPELHKKKTRMYRHLNKVGAWRDPRPGD